MKKIFFAGLVVSGLVALFFFCPGLGLASPAPDPVHLTTQLPHQKQLRQEADKLADTLKPAKPAQIGEAALLRQAAAIMERESRCKLAVNLMKQAAVLGERTDDGFWLDLARIALCAKQWNLASQAALLARTGAGSDRIGPQSLRILAHALWKRSQVKDEWLADARAAFEALIRQGGNRERDREILRELQAAEQEQTRLRIVSATAETENGHPELCLRFNDDLAPAALTDYARYIRVTPKVGQGIRVSGRRLCLAGARWGTTYRVTVRQGLPGRNGKRALPRSRTMEITTGHAPASVWFDQSDYVLAGLSSPAVTINTRNVDRVDVRLFRVHERNLLTGFIRRTFRKSLDGYELDRIRREIGQEVWQGTVAVEAEKDKAAAGNLMLPKKILTVPGLYVLVATDGSQGQEKWKGRASQWLVITDIGLTTYQGSDGMVVIARSLESARPLAGIGLTLYARNNVPLAVQVTDDQGRARFAPGLFQGRGGRQAMQLVAADQDHGFVFLRLDQAPFDLSDRGVSGRPAPGPLDGYVYSDRGIYRPGETVNLVTLLRDRRGRPVPRMPLTLRLVDPIGRIKVERLLEADRSSAYVAAVKLPRSALTGSWQARLYADPEGRPVGETRFQVAAFKPPRLAVQVSGQGAVKPGVSFPVQVQADYLYGAPGSDLEVSGFVRWRVDHHPFAEYQQYWFGLDGETPDLEPLFLEPVRTDAQGRAILPLRVEAVRLARKQPLQALLNIEVSDVDGQAVATETVFPVRHLDRYVGIGPRFTGDRVEGNSSARFRIVVLDNTGLPLTLPEMTYRLVREEIEYQWFRKNGHWGMERVVNDHLALEGTIRGNRPGVVDLTLAVRQGRYRLELADRKNSEVVASYRFTAGDRLEAGGDRPDGVRMVLDRNRYRAGDTAHLTLKAPYPGEVDLVIAKSGVMGIESFSMSGATSRTLEIPVREEWDGGVYLLASVYHPGEKKAGGVARAIGVIWLPIESADRQLSVGIKAPDQTRPRQRLVVPVQVNHARPGSPVHLTLAAVDEAVLRITGYTAPDPLAWYFGRIGLGVQIRDLYSDLIRVADARPLMLRTGAGEDEVTGLRGAPESNIRVVSLFSGVIEAGPDGQARVPLDLPDFNGQLRLMAVAWSGDRMGSASQSLRVNDPVVVSPSLPRFLALDDQARIRVLLDNVDGAPGRYRLQWSANGAVRLETGAGVEVELNEKQRRSVDCTVRATTIGRGRLHLLVTGPQGYRYEGDFTVGVRGKALRRRIRHSSRLEPDSILRINREWISGLLPETATVTVSVASTPNLDVPGLLEQLSRYPYGCLEQLTSRAMPLLYGRDLAHRWGAGFDFSVDGRINDAIEQILQKQLGSGGFSLWTDFGEEEYWLSAYAMDFLSRAREKGYMVPGVFFERGLRRLTELIELQEDLDRNINALAYMAWVLARNGRPRTEDARYLFDTFRGKISSPLALAQLSGALALAGDQQRATRGMDAALELLRHPRQYSGYGSRIRDLAGIITVLAGVDRLRVDPAPLWTSLTRALARRQILSTQEQAWLILAALTLEPGKKLDLAVNRVSGSERIKDQDYYTLGIGGEELADEEVVLENLGAGTNWVVISVEGDPLLPQPAVDDGITVERRLFSLSGQPIQPEAIQQGDLVVVSVTGALAASEDMQLLLVDLLPAGFEIDREMVAPGTPGRFAWLKPVSRARYRTGRDDRMVVAFNSEDLNKQNKRRIFHFAWLVRAVTPGQYSAPPPEVEAMYRPELRGSGQTVRVVIHGPETGPNR